MTSETRNNAFTLVEMILVVAIIALATAIVAPLMADAARGLAGQAAAYELLSLLREARWYAADTGQSCIVRLEPTDRGYRWEVFQAPVGEELRAEVEAEWAASGLLEKIEGLMRIPPDRQLRTTRAMDIRLEPWGTEADYVIDLGGRRPMRIEIRRPSGMAWLVDADPDPALDTRGLSEAQDYWEANCRALAQ